MKKVRITTAIMAMAFLSLSAMSCRDTKKDDSHHRMDSEMMDDGHHQDSSMHHDNMGESGDMMDSDTQNSQSKQVLADYMSLKDALVATDEKAAANAGKKLENTLKNFKVDSYTSEDQKELKEIIETATEHAEHISRSDIAHQREHFQMLTKDITDMVTITGTANTLYQQFCPMYAGNKGGAWLSMEKEIRNPYFGDKMMKCGKVQKEIN